MVLETYFYDILSVRVDSSTEEIAKAYRKQALRCHPDKTNHNPQLTERFKEMTHAYEVLKDEKLRKLYDKYGEAGLDNTLEEAPQRPNPPQQRRPCGFATATDIFSQVFSDFNSIFSESHFQYGPSTGPRFSFGGASSGSTQGMNKIVEPVELVDQEFVRGQDIHHTCRVTLGDLYYGKTIKLQLPKTSRCDVCNAVGGVNAKTCRICRGLGKVVTTYYNDFSQYQQYGSCKPCRGTGVYIAAQDRCPECDQGYKREKKLLRVNVLPGSKHDDRIVLQGEADEGRNVIPGDVVIHLSEIPHKYLVRKYNDLYMEHEIDLRTALLGGSVELHDFIQHGESVRIFVNVHGNTVLNESMHSSIKQGEVIGTINLDEPKIVRGFGMPINEMVQDGEYVESLNTIDNAREVAFDLKRYKFGNLFINFKVRLPSIESFTEGDLVALNGLLPPATKTTTEPMKEATLGSISSSRKASPQKQHATAEKRHSEPYTKLDSSTEFNYDDIEVSGDVDDEKEEAAYYNLAWGSELPGEGLKRRKQG